MEHDKILSFSHKIDIQIAYVPSFFSKFGVTGICSKFRLLQTVLFLTDYVFVALCAYFDESMDCIGGISHGNVRI